MVDLKKLVKMNGEERVNFVLDGNFTLAELDEIIDFLSKEDDTWTLSDIGRFCEDLETMRHFACIDNESIKTGLADNEKVSVDLLLLMANDPLNWVQYHVARNPKTPANVSLELYTKLAKCDDIEVRRNLAEDRLPKQIYGLLADDEDEQVRISVAENDRTPKEVLTAMADDESEDVRYSLLTNIHTPNAIKKRLEEDEDVENVGRSEIENIMNIFK